MTGFFSGVVGFAGFLLLPGLGEVGLLLVAVVVVDGPWWILEGEGLRGLGGA